MKYLILLLFLNIGCKKVEINGLTKKVDTLEAKFIFSSNAPTMKIYELSEKNNHKIGDSVWVNGVTWFVAPSPKGINGERMVITKLKL